MLATTGVPGKVLGLRDFLEVGRPDEDPSVRPLFGTLRGPRGTRRGTYSSYTSTNPEETPGSTVENGNLLVAEAPASFSPAFAKTGRTSRGIGSTKLRPNSYTTRQRKVKQKWIQQEYTKYPDKEINNLQLEASC